MVLQTQTKRYRETAEESSKGRQLSGLFSIISNNLLLATEVLSTDYKVKTVSELESLSRKARILAKELASNTCNLRHEDLVEKVSLLKNRMLSLVEDLTGELAKLDTNKNSDKRVVEDIVLAKRLLRDSQRGLVTIRD